MTEGPSPGPTLLRLVTYNIRGSRGSDGRYDLSRIARVLSTLRADLVCLQEVDVLRRRSGRVDQPRELARELGMASHAFAPAWNDHAGAYGNAILSRAPLEIVRQRVLPMVHSPALSETRTALWVRVPFGAATLDLVTTHLSLRPATRSRQIDALLGPTWLSSTSMGPSCVLAGDLNEIPRTAGYRRLVTALRDAEPLAASLRAATWPASWPVLRLDHVLVRGVEVRRTLVERGALARLASDHLPVLVEVASRRPP